MTIRTWHFYRLADGILLGRSVTLDDDDQALLQANIPADCGAVAEVDDWQAQRVDLATGYLIDWQPPAPADTDLQAWRWDDAARRWLAVPTLAALKATRVARLQQAIEAQEAAQARPVRELLAAMLSGGQADQAARDRFAAVSAKIAALQLKRAAVEAAASAQELDAIPE